MSYCVSEMNLTLGDVPGVVREATAGNSDHGGYLAPVDLVCC